MRLKIELPRTWAPAYHPDAAATFCRKEGCGAFQVSWGEYLGEELPVAVTVEFLKEMAEKIGQRSSHDERTESSGGVCRYGIYGTVVFRSAEHPRAQVWVVSDGRNMIYATHTCGVEPSASEVAEAHQIATSLALGLDHPPKPKWKFW